MGRDKERKVGFWRAKLPFCTLIHTAYLEIKGSFAFSGKGVYEYPRSFTYTTADILHLDKNMGRAVNS